MPLVATRPLAIPSTRQKYWWPRWRGIVAGRGREVSGVSAVQSDRPSSVRRDTRYTSAEVECQTNVTVDVVMVLSSAGDTTGIRAPRSPSMPGARTAGATGAPGLNHRGVTKIAVRPAAATAGIHQRDHRLAPC